MSTALPTRLRDDDDDAKVLLPMTVRFAMALRVGALSKSTLQR